MNHDNGQTQQADSRHKLAEVAAAGETLGYWKIGKISQPEGSDSWQRVQVIADDGLDGLAFSLRGGSWGRESKISASVAHISGPHGLESGPSDVLVYREEAPEASASRDRPAETIARDLYRRVVGNAEARDIARRVRERLGKLVEQHQALRRHVAALERFGYSFTQLSNRETYKASGWRGSDSPPCRVEVTCDGRVSFEAETTVDRLAAVLEALRGAIPQKDCT